MVVLQSGLLPSRDKGPDLNPRGPDIYIELESTVTLLCQVFYPVSERSISLNVSSNLQTDLYQLYQMIHVEFISLARILLWERTS